MQPERVTLGVGDSVAGEGRPRVTFVRVVQDSRCPTGVTCVWEGDAVVEIEVRDASGAAEVVTLHANPRFAQEAEALGLRVRLERLTPHPAADAPVSPEAYRVELSLTSASAAPVA
jgi:hypothetical protein